MRNRLAVYGTKARTLIGTGAAFLFVAKQFVQEVGIPTIHADAPLKVARAGARVIRQLITFAMLQAEATTPMTKAVPFFEVRAYILDIAKNDVILRVDVNENHLIPLMTELLQLTREDFKAIALKRKRGLIPPPGGDRKTMLHGKPVCTYRAWSVLVMYPVRIDF